MLESGYFTKKKYLTMWEVENLSVCNTISEAFGEDSLGWVTR